FPDGVYFVPLAALRDPALVPEALHKTLGLAEATDKPLLTVVVDALRTRQVLIVLDNFEQVIEAQAVVTRILSACPTVKLIVTSRIPLRLRAEREWPVAPLTVPRPRATTQELQAAPAIQLFLERARAVKPNLALTDVILKAVAEICARLDGLPLAIELAAARIRLLTPQAMLSRLNERLKLLSAGPRDLPLRQQTLRAAIDWSYDLLEPPQRTVFRRLAVFVGGFTLEAAEQVLSLGATSPLPVFDNLDVLVNESLVQQREDEQGQSRFSLLQTIREYALERLDESGEADLLARQHGRYYVQLAETAEPELTGLEQSLWLGRLEVDHDNLNAALDWTAARDPAGLGLRAAAALWRFWYVRGFFIEGRRWLGRLLAQPPPTASRSLALAWRGAGVLADSQGDVAGAEAAFQQSLAVFRALNDLSGMARAGNSLGIIALRTGDRARARGYFQDSLTIFRNLNDQRAIAHSLNQLGTVAGQDGDYVGARRLYEQSLSLFRALGDEWGTGLGLINLGEVAAQQSDSQAAQRYYAESLGLFQALGDRWFMARVMDYCGILAVSLGQARRAGRLLGAAQAIRGELGAALNPNDQSRLDLSLQQARAADAAAFNAGWEEGGQMTLERATALVDQHE
ncbi:MAG: tetratricopeptide repeat protein, partial [Anaerolineae bacterium]|nr:tetratricopeptide repeat protein [Anaerolineae bacterium]